MFGTHLDKYKKSGFFAFHFSKSFKDACNAPDNLSGVYLIFKVVAGNEELIYIGSSGQKGYDGTIKHRNGGMKDRLINGYHPNRFGNDKRIRRHIALPQQMKTEGVSEIKIYWWVTYDEYHQDFPTDIEKILMQEYFLKYKTKPSWHK